MPLIVTDEQKKKTSQSVREYWANATAHKLSDVVGLYGMDIVMELIREEIAAILEPEAPPVSGTRRELAKAVLNLVARSEPS